MRASMRGLFAVMALASIAAVFAAGCGSDSGTTTEKESEAASNAGGGGASGGRNRP